MPAGRLTLLASQVTSSAGSSISGTIPNDGSVVAGQDLLIVAAALASGSRTMSISGGAGGWTDHGRQSFTGHGSEVWTKVAAAGDLGATITVTPSTGSIQQILFIAMVEDVNPSTPLGSPAAVSGTQSSTGSTTHVTSPSVASTAAGTREISIVFDSQVSPQTWTAPAAIVELTENDTPTAAGGSTGALGDAASLTSGTIGSRTWTKSTSSAGSAWTLGALSSSAAVTGDASLASTATLSATGSVGASLAASLTATATLSASGSLGAQGAASLAATATLTATGVVNSDSSGDASLAVTATLSASGAVTLVGVADLAATAELTASGEVTTTVWIFTPPTVEEGPAGLDPLFHRVKLTRGVSVQELPQGTFRTLRFPTQDEIADAHNFYLGGHEYPVDGDTKDALIGAGIGLTEDNFVLG